MLGQLCSTFRKGVQETTVTIIKPQLFLRKKQFSSFLHDNIFLTVIGNIIGLYSCDIIFSRTNADSSSEAVWLIFNLPEKVKVLDMHTHFICLCDYSLAFYCLMWSGHTWAASVLLVLIRIGPSCLHVSVDRLHCPLLYMGLFTDAFTFFPQSLFSLVVLDLGAWSKVASSLMCA